MNIIYTAIFNNYDQLREINLEPGWRAICFTNQDLQSDSWEIKKIDDKSKIFRQIKTMPFHFLPHHEKNIWIDGNLQLQISLDKLIDGKNGFWLMNHPDRNCIYEEAKKCIELGKDDPKIINEQMYRYLLGAYPHKNGLSATGVLIRDHSVENINFGQKWWNEIEAGSVRDQLSFNYVAWKLNLMYGMFPFLENVKYYYHTHKIKEIEERERLRREEWLKAGKNRTTRDAKLRARKTAGYYKIYGSDGDNK